jgi:hypothetical protein
MTAQDMFTSVDKAVADVNTPAISNEIRDMLAEIKKTNEYLQRLLIDPESDVQIANLAEAITVLNRSLTRLDRLLLTERPQIELIMANFERISENIKDLTESLKQHPSSLFFSEPPSQPEVSK